MAANGGDRILRPYLSTDMAERLLDRNAKLIAGILRLRASANDAHQRDGTGTENGDPAAAKRFDRRADRLEDQLARNLAALARWASKVKSLSARHSLCSGTHGRVHLDPRVQGEAIRTAVERRAAEAQALQARRESVAARATASSPRAAVPSEPELPANRPASSSDPVPGPIEMATEPAPDLSLAVKGEEP